MERHPRWRKQSRCWGKLRSSSPLERQVCGVDSQRGGAAGEVAEDPEARGAWP